MPVYVGGTPLSAVQLKYRNETSIINDGLVNYLDASLISSYSGSGTTWTDITGNYNATLVNGLAYSTGSGGHFQFDGVNDYANLGDISALNFTSGIFSVDAWVYVPSTWTSGSQYPNLISKGGAAGWDTNGWSMFVFRARATPYSWGCGMRNGGSVNIVETSMPSNAWTHISMTLDGSTIRLYVNGLLVTSGTQTIAPGSNSTEIWIGNDPYYVIPFPGGVGSCKMYNKALSAAEVLQNFKVHRRRFGL